MLLEANRTQKVLLELEKDRLRNIRNTKNKSKEDILTLQKEHTNSSILVCGDEEIDEISENE